MAGGAVVAVVALVVGLVTFFGRVPETAPVAGSVGDERTADPCSLLDLASGARFGTVVLDIEYGGFNRCGLLIKRSGDPNDQIHVQLLIQDPPEFPAQPHTAGKISAMDRPPERDGVCERSIRLSDGNQVVISARHQDGRQAELCAVAEAAANGTLTALSRGQILRRTMPFPSGSLAHVDACALIEDEDIVKAVGERGIAPSPAFGDWICYWERDPIEMEVAFVRGWKPVPGENELIKVGSRDAYIDPRTSVDEGLPLCVIQVVHRPYVVAENFQKDWVEMVEVSVEIEENPQLDKLCDSARTLAEAVVKRLPPV